MYIRAIDRRLTQMIAYFLVMNSKRCNNWAIAACMQHLLAVILVVIIVVFFSYNIMVEYILCSLFLTFTIFGNVVNVSSKGPV